jgi:hypothetical protein
MRNSSDNPLHGDDVEHADKRSVGKRTLSHSIQRRVVAGTPIADLPAAPVQLRYATAGPSRIPVDDPFGMHLLTPIQRSDGEQTHAGIASLGAEGISETSTSLPYLAEIQHSFGSGFDLSGVEAHVGGKAADAAHGMGAAGYATGNHVAFGSAPDLDLATHEAAHVIQQGARREPGEEGRGNVQDHVEEFDRRAAMIRGEDPPPPKRSELSPRQKAQREAQIGAAAENIHEHWSVPWMDFYSSKMWGTAGIIAFEGGSETHIDIYRLSNEGRLELGSLDEEIVSRKITIWYAPV